ncbi:branched-chain amino acid ABC transporter [Campylobacter sp. MIT 99-7217]|uniref:branched-chain amino acid transporter permease n=1 Tax=Campylobacter sp. MIT 99-7217 TaxID=535091 RepID=UPI00115C3C8B|nr:AzlD domain-containing protein [Campylobacter sp. MIT 99-7217]TQR33005.1 branched-chain amino acid ABC transporter [Campylobacter sp. MIT 99-7217]
MFDEKYFFLALLMGYIATYGARILPFLLFKHKQEGENLVFIQKNMPLVIMVILVFYTFFIYDFSHTQTLVFVLVSCIFTLVLQLCFKSALISISLGIIFYMAISRIFG